MDEEYTRGLYPDNGRVIDFFFLFWGLVGVAFLFLFNSLDKVLSFLKTPGITAFYLIIMITIPIIILMGYFKRFFERMGKHESVTVFLAQSFLDFMHTLFLISVSVLMVPVLGYLIGPIK
ncbi:Uncharacterised protein [Candidatus Bilamarchaeum dharawalense]|uniref:Uncharacterized protein n=1 Tax=Candidatus Bilamarchaeum dharawalense TaxID=2885759 RepID=A0A5E4LWI3_9ARCH|nr:Uncharacterised protein [Candidatus Bilamarchaeum dharawalense]